MPSNYNRPDVFIRVCFAIYRDPYNIRKMIIIFYIFFYFPDFLSVKCIF